MSDDLFAQLVAVSWRGVSFPISTFSTSLEQDLVEHKFTDEDGAHVEATGRQPLVFSCHALFRNGVVPGATEKWGLLYPEGWRAFYAAAADRSTGTLIHPELGEMKCKLRSAVTQWNSATRDGVDVEISWVESTDTGADLLGALASESPVSSAFVGALDLDAALSDDARRLAFELTGAKEPDEPTFADMLNGIQAYADAVTVQQRRTVGMLEGAVYRARLLADSVTRAADPKQWPVKRAAARIEAAVNDVRAGMFKNEDVSIYVTPRAMSLASIAAAVQRSVNALIRLNPALVRRPTVPAETRVRYLSDA